MELGGPCSRLGEGLDEVWIHLLQAAVLLLSCLEAGWPEDSRALGWALTELRLASADGGHDSWCYEGEDSSNYQLPHFLALWPELKAAVWIMSPRVFSWLSWAREDDRDLRVIVREPDALDFKRWRQAQALAGCLQESSRIQCHRLRPVMVISPGKPPLRFLSIWMDSQGSRSYGPL